MCVQSNKLKLNLKTYPGRDRSSTFGIWVSLLKYMADNIWHRVNGGLLLFQTRGQHQWWWAAACKCAEVFWLQKVANGGSGGVKLRMHCKGGRVWVRKQYKTIHVDMMVWATVTWISHFAWILYSWFTKPSFFTVIMSVQSIWKNRATVRGVLE